MKKFDVLLVKNVMKYIRENSFMAELPKHGTDWKFIPFVAPHIGGTW